MLSAKALAATVSIIGLLLAGCATSTLPDKTAAPSLGAPLSTAPSTPLSTPSAAQLDAATQAGIDAATLTTLINKPLYRMPPAEVDRYIRYVRVMEPDLRKRVAHLARRNIGQPYELYLLGEFPFENIDDQPLFNLEKSDCVVFAEHTYAMALSGSWAEFFWMLQRIRYRDGVIGVTTRNHYTETDWNPQNAWLVRDISSEIAGERASSYALTVDRQRFFRTRYKLDVSVPIAKTQESFVPLDAVPEGDLVNVVSGKDGGYWVSHVGLIVLGGSGERRLLHSAEPAVREESFAEFIEAARAREARQAATGKPGKLLMGFKFLRLNDAPNPPPMAPQPRPAAAVSIK
jgi:hypothetical protein